MKWDPTSNPSDLPAVRGRPATGLPSDEREGQASEKRERQPFSLRELTILGAVSVAAFMVPLDITVVVVALSAISRDLQASLATLEWIINAYTVTFGALLLVAGNLADLIGRRRALLVGTTLFSLASLACGLAPGAVWLAAFRVVQGAGAALTLSSALAVLSHAFPQGPRQAAVFAAYTAIMSIGSAFGPFIGGALVESFGWRSIFLANVPVGIATLAATMLSVRESHDPLAKRLDWPGAVTFAAGFGLLTGALILAAEHAWTSPLVVGTAALGALSLVAFIRIEMSSPRALLDLSLFRSARFTSAVVVSVLSPGSFWALLVSWPIYFTVVHGLSPTASGMALLPMTVPLFIMPLLVIRFAGTIPDRAVIIAGQVLIAVALILATVTVYAALPMGWILAETVLMGIGAGIVNTHLTRTVVTAVTSDRSGMAAGISTTARQIGFALGVALLGLATLLGIQIGLDGVVAPEKTVAVARSLAAGDLTRAVSLLELPDVDPQPTLRGILAANFALTLTLAAIGASLGALAAWAPWQTHDTKKIP